MKELLVYIAQHLVDNPDQVSVEAVMSGRVAAENEYMCISDKQTTPSSTIKHQRDKQIFIVCRADI